MFAPGASGYPDNGIIGPVADPYTSSTGWLYHGMDILGTKGAETSNVGGEDTGEQECPDRPPPGQTPAFVQTVFIPVVLPPNSKWNPINFTKFDKLGRLDPSGNLLRYAGTVNNGSTVKGYQKIDLFVGYDAYGRPAIMAPMGSECHPRHPHGIAIDRSDGLVYVLIEHMGLQWNADRTDFDMATTTDDEAGGALVFDIHDIAHPRIVTAYLAGHGAHELEASQQNGFLFMPNHEESPNTQPSIFQVVVNPFVGMKQEDRTRFPLAPSVPPVNELGVYGFIDTGYYQALQDIAIDDEPGGDNNVYMVSHVGERMYAIDGSCTPTPNTNKTFATSPYPPHKTYLEKSSGENCIKYWVDIRTPWNTYQGSVAQQIFSTIDVDAPESCLPSVLHFHNLGFDPVHKKVYNGLHSIHHAEHTGMPWENAKGVCPETEEDVTTGEEPEAHYNGRDVVEVDVNPAHMTVDPVTKQATTPTVDIDLSHGYDYLAYPNVDNVVGDPTNLDESISAMNTLENSFVHPHWLAVDPGRNALVVTGEHTGNLGVIDTTTQTLTQVLPVSVMNAGLRDARSSDCSVDASGVPDDLEPHMHGVQIDPTTGNLYLSDEGEHCFYEGTFILKPNP